MTDLVLRGGHVVDGTGREPFRADVMVENGRVTAVGGVTAEAPVLDCSGRYILPGFVDAHSHADASLFDPAVQLALLRQGVTTIVVGQDGVSYAPGDGRYASDYFGALLGAHPTYRGGGVADLLARYDGQVPLNVAYLVPHGTVRIEAMGTADRAPDERELAVMTELVAQGLAEGACGLSTGLDYLPGQHADVAELSALCRPVALAGGVYVTHMRGGYEHNSAAGVAEVRQICQEAGVPAHISHYHGPVPLVADVLDDARRDGVDLTFDAYPYRSGYTLLSMPTLPAELLAQGTDEVVRQLADSDVRRKVTDVHLPTIDVHPSLGPGWAARMRLAYVGAPDWAWAEGLTVADAAARARCDVGDFVLDLLVATRLAVTAVMPLPPGRRIDELAALVRHKGYMLGTDGIYLGGHPHPRGWGSFARVLGRHVRDRHDISWGTAALRLSAAPVDRFGLGQRGRIQPGSIADLIVVDPVAVRDTATYDDPRALAQGIDDVLLAGTPVLSAGQLTQSHPGRGLRRSRFRQ